MKKLILLTTILLAFSSSHCDAFDQITQDDIPKILSIIRDGTKEHLPIILDDYTTVFDIVSVQNVIEYRNSINTSNEHIKTLLSIDKESLIKATFENNRNYLCGDEETRLLLQKGAIFVYVFYDFLNTQLFKFSVQNSDCP